jgi:hypothetical protein
MYQVGLLRHCGWQNSLLSSIADPNPQETQLEGNAKMQTRTAGHQVHCHVCQDTRKELRTVSKSVLETSTVPCPGVRNNLDQQVLLCYSPRADQPARQAIACEICNGTKVNPNTELRCDGCSNVTTHGIDGAVLCRSEGCNGTGCPRCAGTGVYAPKICTVCKGKHVVQHTHFLEAEAEQEIEMDCTHCSLNTALQDTLGKALDAALTRAEATAVKVKAGVEAEPVLVK